MENELVKISAHLKGQFLRLYQMAASDGDFSPTELEMLYEYALSRGVSKDQLMTILASPVGKIEIPEDLETKVTYLYDLTQMIWADGQVDEDEMTTLKKYAKRFGFMPDNVLALADYLISSVKENKTLESVLNEIKE